ncbi:hypothetical protein HH310_40945 [Actinoplanes sp. TBRC 11911]|uniref:NACHT domain-containing protein n=1 Tax=Actinoplanes sp. TBRC 11911 TaxID=2729386 RepID=UPI00145C55FE|nr:hypothetical protein [Actinoplanes sp. TBRC 11911]NMO57523.1 hypothetical protein [Actinoplanes sp. TBRC 11911]
MTLRKAGWALSATGLLMLAVGIPIAAWTRRRDLNEFNAYVGWSNILGMSLGAVGLAFLIWDRLKADSPNSRTKLLETSDILARAILKRESLQLARLLGTDELERRAARVTLIERHRVTSRRSGTTPQRSKSIHLDSIDSYYTDSTSGRMLLTGDPGSGKTVALLTLVTNLLNRRRDAANNSDATTIAVPVLFGLPSWPGDQELFDWMSADLVRRFGIRLDLATSLIAEGMIIPILDSLDEVDPGEGDSSRSTAMVSRINRYTATSVGIGIVVTCRSGTPRSANLKGKLRGFTELEMQPLKGQAIAAYMAEHGQGNDPQTWQGLADAASVGNSPVQILLGVPWRLAMATAFYNGGGDAGDLLPTASESRRGQKALRVYLERVEPILLESFLRYRSLHFGRDPKRSLKDLTTIATLANKVSPGTRRDAGIILPDWASFMDSVSKKKSPLLESLGLLAAVQAPFAVYQLLHWLGLANYPGSEPTNRSGWPVALSFSANLLLVSVLTATRASGESFPRAITSRRLRTKKGAAIASVVTLCVGVTAIFSFAVLDKSSAVLYTASLGLAGVTAVILNPYDPAQYQAPTDILRRDLYAACMIGAATGFLQFVALEGILGPQEAACFGFSYVISAVITSSFAKYLRATWTGYSQHGLPLRFAAFLAWGTTAGLLRMSGTAYEYRHTSLRDYLLRRGERKIEDSAPSET